MLRPVSLWMESQRLAVKTEFLTPWGKCDVVGLRFRKQGVAKRLRLQQRDAITSMARATILHCIPERGGISLRHLASKCAPTISSDTIYHEAERLISENFVMRLDSGRVRRVNGWVPLHSRFVAIELKLQRIEEAMLQASSNLGFAQESFVALPRDLALRVKLKPSRWEEFIKQGVGVIGVHRDSCQVLIDSRRHSQPDPLLQFYSVEKFWRMLLRGNSS